MTEQATTPEPAAHTSDPWQIWFSRLIQVAGLGIVIFETLAEHADRPWLLLVSTAMMIGGLGLQLVIRWAIGRIS